MHVLSTNARSLAVRTHVFVCVGPDGEVGALKSTTFTLLLLQQVFTFTSGALAPVYFYFWSSSTCLLLLLELLGSQRYRHIRHHDCPISPNVSYKELSTLLHLPCLAQLATRTL